MYKLDFQWHALSLLKYTYGWCLKWTWVRTEALVMAQHPDTGYTWEGGTQEPMPCPGQQPYCYRRSGPKH